MKTQIMQRSEREQKADRERAGWLRLDGNDLNERIIGSDA